MVIVTVETDCHLGLEMVVVTVVMDCHLCLEHLVSRVDRKDLGWMDKHRKEMFRLVFRTPCSSSSSTATTSKCVTECAGICEHDKPGCRW